jgi:hypothetical protein
MRKYGKENKNSMKNNANWEKNFLYKYCKYPFKKNIVWRPVHGGS